MVIGKRTFVYFFWKHWGFRIDRQWHGFVSIDIGPWLIIYHKDGIPPEILGKHRKGNK